MTNEDGRYDVPPDGKVHYFFQPLTEPNNMGFVAGRIVRVGADGAVTSFFAGSGGYCMNPTVPRNLLALPGSVQDLVKCSSGGIDADASGTYRLGAAAFDASVAEKWRIGGSAVTDISIPLGDNVAGRGGFVIHSSRGEQGRFTVTVDGQTRQITVPRSAGCVTLIGDECDRFADQYRRDLAAGNVDPNFVVVPTNVALARNGQIITSAGPGSAAPGATYAAAPSASTTGEGDRDSPASTATGQPVVRLADATSPDPVTPASASFADGLGQALALIFAAFFGEGNVRDTFASGTHAGPDGVPPEGGPTLIADRRSRSTEPSSIVQI